MSHQLTDPNQVRDYVFGGKGTFTLVSTGTGNRFTFKLGVPKYKQEGRASPIFVRVLSGPDNETAYSYIGCIWDGEYQHGRKSCVSQDAQSVRAFRWFLRDMPKALSQCQFWHEGTCGRCGRKLTVPESIAAGFGPHCIQVM